MHDLGHSGQLSLLLTPAYKPLTVLAGLLRGYGMRALHTSSVLSYISLSMDNATSKKQVRHTLTSEQYSRPGTQHCGQETGRPTKQRY